MTTKRTTAPKKTLKSALQQAYMEDLEDSVHEKDVNRNVLQFIEKLVLNTQPQSPLAYRIAQYLEENTSLVPALKDVFPQARATHSKRQSKSESRIEEAQTELAGLNAEILRLSKKKKHAGKGEHQILVEELEDRKMEMELVNEEIEKLRQGADYKPTYSATPKDKTTARVNPKDWKILQDTLRSEIKKMDAAQGDMYENMDMLCRELHFNDKEKALMRLLITTNENPDFGVMIDALSSRKMPATYDLIARMVNLPRKEVTAAFDPEAPLSAKGFIFPRTDDEDYEPGEDSAVPLLATDLLNILKEPDLNMDVVARRLIGEPVTTTLDWDRDFKHLGDPGEELVRIMKGAKESGAKGVNFLLYGLQDSGKTEAVKAAAKKAGITLYMVGEKAAGGIEPSRTARIQSAMMAQALLQDRKDAAILFDEMEDVLPNVGGGLFAPPPSAPSGISKVFLNRMLENNQTMTLWTANDPERFHPAVKRRIRFSIEFNIPPVSVREQMWMSISARRDFNLSQEEARKLAREYKAPPGMIDTAIRNAVQTGDIKTIRTSLAASADLVFGNRDQIIVRNPLPEIYNPALLRAHVEDSDITIHELTTRIEQSDAQDFGMLLYGEPGTGKSAYAVHLAHQLGMEVSLKKASDLMGKYVGENEQNIARAFKEAADGKKFLIIDEADSFLRNRSGAEKSWEVSMVNEMLTQMEAHPLPFVMTTNLFNDIDPAAKRRFLFKLKFSALDNEQAKLAFREFFNTEAPDSLTSGNVPLAPADFALVKRQMRFLEANASPERLAELVKAEAKTRMSTPPNGYGDNKVGFLAPLPARKVG